MNFILCISIWVNTTSTKYKTLCWQYKEWRDDSGVGSFLLLLLSATEEGRGDIYEFNFFDRRY